MQPLDIHGGVVASGRFPLGVSCTADIHHVNESVGVTQVVQEFVTEASPLMSARDQSCHV